MNCAFWLDIMVGVTVHAMAAVMFLCFIDSTANDLLQRDGVLVFEEDPARVISGVWTVLVVLQAPITPNLTSLETSIRTQWDALDQHVPAAERQIWRLRLENARSRVKAALDRVRGEQEIAELLRAPASGRARRGLLDFVGRVGKTLFGLSTEQDLKELAVEVEALRSRGASIIQNTESMMTVMNATRSYVRGNRKDIEALQDRSDELNSFLEHMDENLSHQINAIRTLQVRRIIDQLLELLDLVTGNYVTAANQFISQRVQLERGFLTRNILPVKELSSILMTLNGKGHVALSTHWYYQYLRVQPLWYNKHGELAFKVIVPAVDLEQFLTYRIQYYPISLTGNLTRTISGHHVVALSTESGVSFIPDANNCAGGTPLVCYPAVHNKRAMCESQLILGQPPLACNITIRARPVQASLVFRSRNDVTMVTVDAFRRSKVIKRCPGVSPDISYVTGIQRVALGRQCVLETDDWRIKGIDVGSSTLMVKAEQPMKLPAFNYSWPKRVSRVMHREVALHRRLSIPVVQFPDWHDKPTRSGWRVTEHYNLVSSANAAGIMTLILFITLTLGYLRYYMRQNFVLRSEVPDAQGPLIPIINIQAETNAVGLDIHARAHPGVNPPVSVEARAAAMAGQRGCPTAGATQDHE